MEFCIGVSIVVAVYLAFLGMRYVIEMESRGWSRRFYDDWNR